MLKYILELKNRFLLILFNLLSIIIVSYIYKDILLFLFLKFETLIYKELYYFIFTDVIELFSVYIKLILFISSQICLLYFFYHSFVFFSYSFFECEYIFISYIFKILVMIWYFSIIISKYILIPVMWDFFFNFKYFSFVNLHFEAKLNEYFSFYIKLYYSFIIYCQFFAVLFFVLNYFIINLTFIKKYRKLHYFFFVLFSTLITPPDIIWQLFISLSLIFFYEFFLFFNILNKNLTR